MTEDKSKLMKKNMQYDLLDSRRQHDLETIDALMGMILAMYSEDIIWDKLHITDRESQIYQLQLIIKQVKDIIVDSNRKSNEVYRSER